MILLTLCDADIDAVLEASSETKQKIHTTGKILNFSCITQCPWGMRHTSVMHSTGWNEEEISYNHRSKNVFVFDLVLAKNFT